MTSTRVDRAVEAAVDLIEALPASLVYHDRQHTLSIVLPAAQRIARDEGLDAHTRDLITIAAAFHDTGFLEQYGGHEEVSARYAEQAMRSLGFGDDDVAAVRGMILATHLPQSPLNLAEQVMADADLDVLGHEAFADVNPRLREELASIGTVYDDATWLAQQASFLREHSYFTASERRARDAGKRRNLARLEAKARAALP